MRKTLLVLLTTFALALGLAATASAAPTAAYKVTLKLSTTSSVAGKFITVTGKVIGPKAVGRTVTIQRRYVGGPWTTVATTTVKGDGQYGARVETPLGGNTSFRAIKGKSSVRKPGTSPTRSTKVFQWLYLSHQPGVLGSVTPLGQIIGGKSYSHAFYLSDNFGSLNYKTNSLCTKFTTVAAYVKAPEDAAATMDLHLQKSPPTGSPTTTDVSVSTAAVQTITTTLVGTKSFLIGVDGFEPGFYGQLGDPKVYCNAAFLPEFDLTDVP